MALSSSGTDLSKLVSSVKHWVISRYVQEQSLCLSAFTEMTFVLSVRQGIQHPMFLDTMMLLVSMAGNIAQETECTNDSEYESNAAPPFLAWRGNILWSVCDGNRNVPFRQLIVDFESLLVHNRNQALAVIVYE